VVAGRRGVPFASPPALRPLTYARFLIQLLRPSLAPAGRSTPAGYNVRAARPRGRYDLGDATSRRLLAAGAASVQESRGMHVEVGMSAEVRRTVGPGMIAEDFGNAGVRVLATPALIALIEEAGALAIAPGLEPQERSLGTHLDVKHLAATPAGMEVVARATVVGVEGRRVYYAVEAHDAHDKVGEGRMERFVVDLPRFQQRVDRKRAATPDASA
jgi:fluoroacetyl-CoA thioesterase